MLLWNVTFSVWTRPQCGVRNLTGWCAAVSGLWAHWHTGTMVTPGTILSWAGHHWSPHNTGSSHLTAPSNFCLKMVNYTIGLDMEQFFFRAFICGFLKLNEVFCGYWCINIIQLKDELATHRRSLPEFQETKNSLSILYFSCLWNQIINKMTLFIRTL